ncbi:hypothetical protein MTO96_045783 [Rhipicephalus appendiculatus]
MNLAHIFFEWEDARIEIWHATEVHPHLQEQLDLESKRALCLREALPDTPEADRDDAFHRAAQEANALTKRHTDLRQKWELQNFRVVQACSRQLYNNTTNEAMRTQLLPKYEKYMDNGPYKRRLYPDVKKVCVDDFP